MLTRAEFTRLALAAQQDPQPLMERLLAIATKGQPGQPLVMTLKLNKPQRKVHTAVLRQREEGAPPRVLVLKARQPGISTLAAGYVTATALCRPYSNSMIVAHLEESAQKLYKKCQFMLERLPVDFRPRTTAMRRNEMSLGGMPCVDGEVQLSSSIFVGAASGSELWRGMTLTTVHCCLAPDVPVIVDDGRVVPAEALQVGMRVVTHGGHAGRVTALTWQDNPKPAVRVRPALGEPVTLSALHRVWTQRGWVEAGQLGMGDWLSMPMRPITYEPERCPINRVPDCTKRAQGGGRRRHGVGLEIPWTEEVGFAVGYYLAEGHIFLNQKRWPAGIVFARDRDELDWIAKADVGLTPYITSGRTVHGDDSRTVSETRYGAGIAQWIAEHFGRGVEKRIPDWVFWAGKDFCRGILLGYLAGDGSKVQGAQTSVAASSIRASLVTQARDIALTLGFGWAAITYRAAAYRAGRREQAHWTARWHGDGARALRTALGLPVKPPEKKCRPSYRLGEGMVWLPIRSLESVEAPRVLDVAVDDGDHSFRTLHFAVANSEVAYWYYAESALIGILQSVPMTPESLVVIESTANGVGNVFHQEWLRAESGESDFIPVFIPWWELPDAVMMVPTDFELEPEEREMKKAYGLSNEQIQWRRYILYTNCRGNQDHFDQEFPETAAKAFLVTGRPAFNVKKLQEMHEKAQRDPGIKMIMSIETGIRMEAPRGPLTVFKFPEAGHDYTVGCDPSSGVEGGDFSCMQVYDRITSEQVACWHGYLGPVPMAKLSVQLATWYNTALIAPELTGGHGFAMVEELKHLMFPRIYVWQRVDKVRHGITNFYGWETSYRTRPLLIDSFNFALNEGELLLRDPDTIQEGLNFQYVTQTRAEGSGGHDDRIMAMMIAYRVHLEWPMPDTGVPPRVRLEQRPAVDEGPPVAAGSMNKEAWEDADETLKRAKLTRSPQTEYDNPENYDGEDVGPGGFDWVDWVRY